MTNENHEDHEDYEYVLNPPTMDITFSDDRDDADLMYVIG
jgi:hypothetical protein